MVDDRSPDKLSLVLYSGDPGKIHYAFVMASAAAAVGRPVTLFFTMEAIRALAKPGTAGAPDWQSLDRGFAANNVATFAEMLDASIEMGVRFLVCDLGLRAIGLERNQLRSDVPVETGGVVTFLGDASKHGATIFI
jgi:peroxiredoxin family protein